jgi:hypothetical protein
LRELADELEETDAPKPSNEEKPKRRRVPVPPMPGPLNEPSELARAAARAASRRLGHLVKAR